MEKGLEVCNSGFWAFGRREVARNHMGTRLCQSMDYRLVDITRLQVLPRAPKRQLQGCLFFVVGDGFPVPFVAKTAKTP